MPQRATRTTQPDLNNYRRVRPASSRARLNCSLTRMGTLDRLASRRFDRDVLPSRQRDGHGDPTPYSRVTHDRQALVRNGEVTAASTPVRKKPESRRVASPYS